jgi:hypothetical protein
MTDQRQSTLQTAGVHERISHVKRDGFVDSWREIFLIVMLVDTLPLLLPAAFATLRAPDYVIGTPHKG